MLVTIRKSFRRLPPLGLIRDFLFILPALPFRPAAHCRLGFSFRSWRTPWRSLIRKTPRRYRLHGVPCRAACRSFCRCSLHAAKVGVRCSPQLHPVGIFRLSPAPSPFVLHHYGTFAACCRILSARAYTFLCLCRFLGFGCLLRMLLCFGGLSFVRSVHVYGKPPSPGGSGLPPVAPGGGSSLTHFRTAAHAAKPPPAPPSGGCRKGTLRRVFFGLLLVCVCRVSLRFLSAFSPFLSLVGCRSFCRGSSRFALHFLPDDLSYFLPRLHTTRGTCCRRVRRHIVRLAGRFIIFSVCRTIYQILIFAMYFCLQIAKKGALKMLRWY